MVASDQVGISGINKQNNNMAKVYYGGPEAEKRRQLKKDLDKFMKDFGGTPASDPFNPKGRGMGDRFDPTASVDKTDTKVASSLSSGSYGGYVDAGDARGFVSKEQAESMLANPERYKMRPSEIRYLRESMPFTDKVDASKGKVYSDTDTTPSLGARDGSLIAMADTKVNETRREGSKFFSSAFNNESSSQTATDRTRMAGEGIFRSGISSEAFSPTVKPQYQINRERNRPNQNENVAEAGARTPFGSVNLNIARGIDTGSTTNQAEDTSFSSYVRGAKPGQERGNTRLAQARTIAKRNPNVSINKSTGRAEATNDSGKARAQAAALNRKIKGGKPRQSGSERAKAAYRRNIKKGHKGTASAAAANKASMRARAKARHKARQRQKKNKKKCDIRCKYDIMPLTNMNLIRDDLAEVAYFVKEIQK